MCSLKILHHVQVLSRRLLKYSLCSSCPKQNMLFIWLSSLVVSFHHSEEVTFQNTVQDKYHIFILKTKKSLRHALPYRKKSVMHWYIEHSVVLPLSSEFINRIVKTALEQTWDTADIPKHWISAQLMPGLRDWNPHYIEMHQFTATTLVNRLEANISTTI